ncbi:hypothetical protein VMB_14030 [Vibrio mimicus VM603]|uniref:Uncharacterized protein n=1 Tax=Vibrio mimicus VM603 TaxID=671074 RepID=D2YD06_VIBMI|nr:hypothetical protein VMB_14030 [Vibrio mimicus VM603]
MVSECIISIWPMLVRCWQPTPCAWCLGRYLTFPKPNRGEYQQKCSAAPSLQWRKTIAASGSIPLGYNFSNRTFQSARREHCRDPVPPAVLPQTLLRRSRTNPLALRQSMPAAFG